MKGDLKLSILYLLREGEWTNPAKIGLLLLNKGIISPEVALARYKHSGGSSNTRSLEECIQRGAMSVGRDSLGQLMRRHPLEFERKLNTNSARIAYLYRWIPAKV